MQKLLLLIFIASTFVSIAQNEDKKEDLKDKINHAIGKPNQKKSTNGRTTNADLFTRTASTN